MSDDRANPNPPPVDRLSQLWRRVNEHKIVQWSVAYIAIAYAFQHGVVLTGEAFEWPEAVLRVSMLLMIIGLPVVMTLAWYHGERASRHFSAAELTIISLLLVIGSGVFYTAVQPHEEIAAGAEQQTGVEKARAAATSVAGSVSIAVLPFENLSADPEQEFFSAGMTEEITSALAKIPDLRVVARTSAFQFKDQNRGIHTIAQALHATHLVEGSVRKAGTRLRITAQLINADSGVSIWTDNYDRDLTDVFAIQEDIATAIAGALRMPLGLNPGERLVNNRTDDLKAYEDFLRVRAIGPLARTIPNAAAVLEEAIARAPNFAPAWSSAASLYSAGLAGMGRRTGPVEDLRQSLRSLSDKAEKAARRAIELDPMHASGHGELGRIESRRFQWAEAERHFQQAFLLDSNDPETLQAYGLMLSYVGRLKEALQAKEKLSSLEPFVPIYNYQLGVQKHVNGQDATAIAVLEAMNPNVPNYNRNYALATAYASTRQYQKAADTLLLINAETANAQVSRPMVEQAAQLLRTAPAKVAEPRELPNLQADLNFVYAHIGALDRVMEFPERGVELGVVNSGSVEVWAPLYAPLRKTERFKVYARKAGLVDYWRAKGWPDLCRPTTGDDFDCN